MLSLVGIVAGISAVLAIIVTAGIVGFCLLLSWITNSIRGDDERPVRTPRGSGRGNDGGRDVTRAPGNGGAPLPPSAAGGRRRSNSGAYAGSRRSGR